jgi:RNA polymerase sigma factor for flagellar operon FliA
VSAAHPTTELPLTPTQRALVASGARAVEQAAQRLLPRARGRLDRAELVALGQDGLIEAARSYDSTLGVPFTGYAAFRVRGKMLDGMRKHASEARQLLLAARSAGSEYASTVRSSGSVLTDSDADSQAKLNAFSDGVVASMFAALAGMGQKPAVDELFVAREARARATEALERATQSLPERERRLIRLYYHEARSLREVADDLGVAHSTARKYHVAAIDRLAKSLRAQGVKRQPPLADDAY